MVWMYSWDQNRGAITQMPGLPNREGENKLGEGGYSDSTPLEVLPLRDSAGLPIQGG